MNEVLEQELVKIITKATSAAEGAGKFLVEQTPDVINQLLWWEGVISLWNTALPIIIFIPCIILFIRNIEDAVNADEFDKSMVIVILSFVGTFGSFLKFCVAGNLTWLQIWIAPKLFLIEYAAGLVK